MILSRISNTLLRRYFIISFFHHVLKASREMLNVTCESSNHISLVLYLIILN